MTNTRLRNGEIGALQLRVFHMLQQFVRESEGGISRCCLNCQNFDESGQLTGVPESCSKATPPQRPPARIIAYGCPGHTDVEEIPF